MSKMRSLSSFIYGLVGFATTTSIIIFNTSAWLSPKLSFNTIAATPSNTFAKNKTIQNEVLPKRGNLIMRISESRTRKNSLSNHKKCNGNQILTSRSCAGDGLDAEEKRLYNLINQYRAQNGLPPIPFSPSLTLVANRHVQDLQKNIKTVTHSWSNCPYKSSNRATYNCMWKAPQRLRTAYPGYGYENAHGGSGGYRANASSALKSWKSSSAHNAVILNQSIWRSRPWRALGIGIYGGYAVLWFGEEVDPAP